VIYKAIFQANSIYIQMKASALVCLCPTHQLQLTRHNLFLMIRRNMVALFLLVFHQLKILPGYLTHRNQI